MDKDDKNETTRFLGDGVSFKAKLIGILEVSEARGDRMCQEALSDLKMAIRAAGEHKQRITINIAIDGLRLRDEKTGDSLYHHPVHKISFIAQDMTDSRAFGYIFGSPDTGHRFFGIKTDKAASQVVIAMRDLFQVVFALKKKEIELAKQHLDKNRLSTSPLFTENNNSASKITATSTQETSKPSTDGKSGTSNAETKSVPAVADLVDLELELNSLQQGLTQMERITPSDPFGSKDDPFGDSFTSYPKPILPPPPSSGRERSSRVSESSSIFSPKTPHTGISVESGPNDASLLNEATRDPHAPKEFTFSQEFQSDEHSSGDWFTPSAGNSLFEEPPLVPEQQSSKDQHEAKKKEILSQFDVFTDLDPLGIGNNDKQSTSRCTGKIKPYVDKKHFFQELKNPPKKVLNDLVSESQPQEPPLFAATFDQTNNFNVAGQDFATDPFQDDPFDVDPFAENEFMKQDPFETAEPSNEFKNSFVVTLSKSPKTSVLDKQMSLVSSATSAASRNVQFASKRNTFDVHFDGEKKSNKLAHLHENPSLDLSSESECAPEPPPRPLSNLTAIVKPPPLPPKKQPGDTNVKPPPRPPHTDDVLHYEYADHYETAPNSLEFVKNLDGVSPPLPVPARKSKFESDFVAAPERPKKSFGSSGSGTVTQQEDDYLTPVSFLQPKEHVARHAGPLLLPPPQKSNRNKHHVVPTTENSNKTVESKPTPSNSSTNQNDKQLDGLDITLSQLTLSGLNELAMKLHIPASQLSNMTLAQLTKYLSNFIKSEQSTRAAADREVSNASPTFQADFAANFNNLNITNTASCDTYDRYAVFRELMIQEEIKQTKIDTEPEEITENQESSTAVSETTEDDQTMNNLDVKSTNENEQVIVDKYAALREIVEKEIMQKQSDKELDMENENDKNENKLTNDYSDIDVKIENETNIMNTEKNLKDESEVNGSKDQIIEYGTSPNDKVNMKAASPVKLSPVKTVKSPVPVAVTDVIQNSARLNSGSLSDVISGSSPEIDNTGSTSEVVKKSTDATAESWAIFDQPNIVQEAASKEKQNVQSEEGVSPWSSDSKEFGNGSSPPEWRSRGDSGSGGDHHWPRRRPKQREQEGWWDTSAEPEAQYYPPNRRSTDSYDEDCYECYDRPRRRRQAWTQGTQATGGHSSSSRDVSPWEEEPRRRDHRDSNRQTWSSRHARQHTFERHRDRRHTDSWDEEDDYEYEEEHNNRCHWPERHISREPERDRHPSAVRDVENDRWPEEWSDERRHRRRRETDRERWCCPDWEQIELDKPPSRYGSGRWSNPDTTSKWRDRKHDDCYYGRDSQDSPDDHDEHAPHYLAATKRNWKRPSSASEMDRKTGEIKGRQPGQYYLGTGGSDGERERRYKVNRRSKSRDSQFSESTYGRHKIDANSNARSGTHRGKFQHHAKPQQFDGDFVQDELPVKKQSDVGVIKLDVVNKKMATMSRLKKKDGPKVDEVNASTFPRKGMQQRAQSLFENDFVPSETSDSPQTSGPRFASFDLDTSEADSPVIVGKHSKSSRQQQLQSGHVRRTFDTDTTRTLPVTSRSTSNAKERRPSPRFRAAPKCSMFEDDFSPTTEKADDSNDIDEDNGIGSNGIPCIKEEESHANETDDTFVANNNPTTTVPSSSRKSRLSKGRYFASGQLRKSDSVNIFARENDPFDDEFFCGNRDAAFAVERKMPPRGAELKWSEEFDDFDAHDDGK